MNVVRRNPTLLTLLCLAGVTATLMIVAALFIPPAADSNRAPVSVLSTGGTLLALWIGVTFGWWTFAKLTGGLWRMNNDFFWKLFVCAGALGLVLAALSCDLVVITLVRPFYTGDRELTGSILNVGKRRDPDHVEVV